METLEEQQSTRATASHRHRTALFIAAYDQSPRNRKRYFLSATRDGGPVTTLMKLDHWYFHPDFTEAQHVNGLVLFTCNNYCFGNNYRFVFNPTTNKIFKLPDPTNFNYIDVHICYLFAFDESTNEHKILLIAKPYQKTSTVEIMIFSLLNHSWRKINVKPPIWEGFTSEIYDGVCVNSVVYVMLKGMSYDILAFDLKTEKLSIISIPETVVMPRDVTPVYTRNGNDPNKHIKPRIMKINGCVGVVCYDRMAKSNEIDLWILQDCANRVWVRETVKLPESWMKLGGHIPLLEDVNVDEIIFSASKVSKNAICLPVYNMKSRRFKSLEFNLDDEFLCSETMKFNHIKYYVESIMPL